MKTADRDALETRLARQTYQDIDKQLTGISTSDLLLLLDSKSIKVGDMAAELLDRRGETAALINALLNNHIRTALGRVRATNVLNWLGRDVPNASDAHVHLLDDRSDRVLGNALFGIVFMRRRDLLPELQKHSTAAAPGSERKRLFDKAIAALKANNPSLFAPGFDDVDNVWRLNESSKSDLPRRST